MSAQHDNDLDDLLVPTLGSEHEGTGFDRPYNPSSLVLVTFFAGPLLGGWLVAKNFAHLGLHGRFGRWMAVFSVVWLIATVATLATASASGASASGASAPAVIEGPAAAGPERAEPARGPGGASTEAKPKSDPERLARSFRNVLVRILGLLPALAAAYSQRHRYQIFEMTDDEPRSSLKIGIALTIGSIALSFVVAFVWLLVKPAFGL